MSPYNTMSLENIRCRKVVILGSTGSIGQSALKVARDIPGRMQIVGLAANMSDREMFSQIEETRVTEVAMTDSEAATRLRKRTGLGVNVGEGEAGLLDLARHPDADLVIISIVGTAGLRPALAAIEAGKDIAVASKEILVLAGRAIMDAARRHGVRVLPIDSEHNAIFQCLDRSPDRLSVRRIILTASGGPFRQLPSEAFEDVTVEQALKHPTWDMGAKITIDSATLFNKGLEMIEARWLFEMPMQQVDVIVHPQSVIHSMVEFIDGTVLAQLSQSDMCFPIQYAVTWPDRVANTLPPLDFAKVARLDFEVPRVADFPALRLARWAGETGGTLPGVMNAANEVAVDAFIKGKLSFPGIWRLVEETMTAHQFADTDDLNEILTADTWARKHAKEAIPK